MSNDPYVTVLITSYNRADLLRVALDSVMRQDYPADRREIVVVDDGSTDHTAQVVASFGDAVRYVHQENGGINAAASRGFAESRGQVIAQLDSDDTWYPNKLSATVPLFEQTPDLVAVFHDLDIERPARPEPGATLWRSLHLTMSETPCDGLSEYLGGNPVPSWTSGSLWRKSAIERILPFPAGLWGFNDAYCARHILFFGRVCALRTPLGRYLIHGANDYAGGHAKLDASKIERGMREARVMADSFNERCRQFGRKPSARRRMIQQIGLAEVHIASRLLEGKAAAVAWLFNNDLRLPLVARVQLLLNITLPDRLAVFVKNRILGRFVSLD